MSNPLGAAPEDAYVDPRAATVLRRYEAAFGGPGPGARGSGAGLEAFCPVGAADCGAVTALGSASWPLTATEPACRFLP